MKSPCCDAEMIDVDNCNLYECPICYKWYFLAWEGNELKPAWEGIETLGIKDKRVPG
jgi:hypothetical protein